jgi:hypothetical protein
MPSDIFMSLIALFAYTVKATARMIEMMKEIILYVISTDVIS